MIAPTAAITAPTSPPSASVPISPQTIAVHSPPTDAAIGLGMHHIAEGHDHLLFLIDQTLFAQPFDVPRTTLTGQRVVIADGVSSFAPAAVGRSSKPRRRRSSGCSPARTWS